MPKTKQTDRARLLASNRRINKRQMLETLRILRELNRRGLVTTSGYSLAQPFSKRLSASSGDEAEYTSLDDEA